MIGETRGGVEAVKWVAFALMLGDHVSAFVLAEPSPVLYLLGRLVFPLFAMALAAGLSAAGEWTFEATSRRLLFWGLLVQVPYGFVVQEVQLNCLLTFWCAVSLYAAARWNRWNIPRAALALVALFACGFVEYGPVGVLFAVCAIALARARETDGVAMRDAWPGSRVSAWSRRAWLAGFWATLTLLHAINGVPAAMLGPLVFWAVERWGFVPRLPHFFYRAYGAQWCLIGLAAWGLK